MNTNENKERFLTIIGMALMAVLVATNFLPQVKLGQYSLLVGLAFFFIVEAVAKTPDEQSGLRFGSFLTDLKKCGVLLWLIVPLVSCLGSLLLGKLLFNNAFVDHVFGRTDKILNFENMLMLIPQLIIGALGEEIAFRGFFVGKGQKIVGFWPAALAGAAVFSLAHLANGETAIVIYDLAGIFIDAIIYALISRKTNNCLISTVSHFLINIVGFLAASAFFR